MKTIQFGDYSQTPEVGDSIHLQNQSVNVISSDTGASVVNINPEALSQGDLTFIKKLGLTITNPHTEGNKSIADDHAKETFGEKISNFFGGSSDDSSDDDSDDETDSHSDDDDDDDDDGSFFGGGSFGGGSSFGGFGGGGFSGGGASGSF